MLHFGKGATSALISEELYNQAEDGCLYEHKGDFYQITDIEELIEDLEQEAELKAHEAKS